MFELLVIYEEVHGHSRVRAKDGQLGMSDKYQRAVCTDPGRREKLNNMDLCGKNWTQLTRRNMVTAECQREKESWTYG